MDMKSSHPSPVLTDPVPIKSRLGMHSSLLTCSQRQDPSLSSGKYTRTGSRKSTGSLDDVRSNGWLDAMKASSPPRKKLIKGSNVQVATVHYDTEEYHSWMVCLIFVFPIYIYIYISFNCFDLFELTAKPCSARFSDCFCM